MKEINNVINTVGMNLLPMMRSTESFGHDSDIFRPERFLEADVKSRSAMERIVELSFGTGRWMCAGKPLAFMELNKVYFEVSDLPTWSTLCLHPSAANANSD